LSARHHRVTANELLTEARSGLERIAPGDVPGEAVIVDIRSESQRAHDGQVPGSRFIPRNVLEWRLDPASEHRDPELARTDRLVVVMCNEGYQSSLAAATLQRLGLQATDMVGGFQAWRAAGLPVERLP
jgi:rhodanese-related sulfurtransferase